MGTAVGWIWPLLLAVAWGAPDRPPEPGDWGYRPAEGAQVRVNPPSLTWIHHDQAASYSVQWSPDAGFEHPVTVEKIRWCTYTHGEALPPGRYFWRYRLHSSQGERSAWSRARSFVIPDDAVIFPQPTLDQLRRRIPPAHPRLFLRPEEVAGLRQWAGENGRRHFQGLLQEAERLLESDPTPEPAVRGSARDNNTREYWWPNRVQTLKACQEAETLAFVYLLTEDPKYGEAARRWILHLASWDPDGPTNFTLNCEAAKPLLYRLPRAYDWAYNALTEADRERVRQVMRRRAADAWTSWEVREGNGHLTRPYGSHANRTWHKLAECAIAFWNELPEAELWLDYAVNKFYAAYPVWSDDDGGWHEGLSYWGGYMSKVVWWTEVAEKALRIDSFKKPFFHHAGEYALYTAPPGSPDMGWGDQSYRSVPESWSFVYYLARKVQNGNWLWWARKWNLRENPEEPILTFLWSNLPEVAPRPPQDRPVSRVFQDTGVAILNTTLMSAEENVQFRFKASPLGRQSHGHEPHNSFTLSAYGEPLLVNNVYRDWHGSPFHTQWCWSTQAQNALLVDGEGQKKHSPDPLGRIVSWDFRPGADYLAGEATEAYQGKLERFVRHVVFVKPDLIVLADEIEAAGPATLQWMLHGPAPFQVREQDQALVLERGRAGVLVHYLVPQRVRFRQWTGYDPPTDLKYLESRGSRDFPPQWHVEAAAAQPSASTFALTVLRPYRKGEGPEFPIRVQENGLALLLEVPVVTGETVAVSFGKPAVESVVVRKGGEEWTFKAGKP